MHELISNSIFEELHLNVSDTCLNSDVVASSLLQFLDSSASEVLNSSRSNIGQLAPRPNVCTRALFHCLLSGDVRPQLVWTGGMSPSSSVDLFVEQCRCVYGVVFLQAKNMQRGGIEKSETSKSHVHFLPLRDAIHCPIPREWKCEENGVYEPLP